MNKADLFGIPPFSVLIILIAPKKSLNTSWLKSKKANTSLLTNTVMNELKDILKIKLNFREEKILESMYIKKKRIAADIAQ